MTLIRPIPVCMPAPEHAAEVATPPLGGLTVAEWMEMLEANPNSLVHVMRSGPEAADPEGDGPEASGRARLDAMIAEGVVTTPCDPAFYVYQIDSQGVSAAGVVAEVSVAGYRDGRIKRHEDTRTPAEDQLAHHLSRVAAHTDPVALTYRGDPAIDHLLGDIRGFPPVLDFTTADGTRQRVWRSDSESEQALQRRFDTVAPLFITDGHHRLAAAARYARWRDARESSTAVVPGYHYILATLYADTELTLFEFNRCVAAVEGGVGRLLERLEGTVAVDELGEEVDPRPRRRGTIGMIGGGRSWMITIPSERIPDDLYGALDAVLLQELVLGPILGIDDPRTDPRLRYIAGPAVPDPDDLECDVCFLLYPTDLSDVLDIASAGLVMPPKSTWFEPKVWGGVFIRLIE
ncbi:MAG: DUF1015 domain-containing protein [Acidimicrobiia bacterium]|nr:DUF1015 domain-containing protein [Acidimicrobiia bacterium]